MILMILFCFFGCFFGKKRNIVGLCDIGWIVECE